MALSTYNIVAEQGTDYSASVAYADSSNNAINLTGYTARMHVRKYHGSSVQALTLSSTSGLTITALSGTVLISISAAALSAILAGEYVYDMEIVSESGVVTKLVSGTFSLAPEVTR